MRPHLFSSLFLVFSCIADLQAQEAGHLALDSPFASFVQADFPFFTQTVDARKFGPAPERGNLTPRGILIPAGNGIWGCFDPDLLRWALLWRQSETGEYLTMDGMATGSYRLPNRKSASGQKELPRPLGTPVQSLPPLPGVALGERPLVADPRDRGHAEEGELGLGPLPFKLGRFSGTRLTQAGVQLEYTLGTTVIKERLVAEGTGIARLVQAGPRETRLHLRTGPKPSDWLSLEPSPTPTAHRISLGADGATHTLLADFEEAQSPALRWKEPVKTGPAVLPGKDGPWVFDDLPLPMPNPWKRNVRISDLEFFPDGRAAILTFDGDVWITEGLENGSSAAVWRRFASGLHEPQSLCIVSGLIHVFDRNGIVKLVDSDDNGEADWHANVSNAVAQSAETRNYPMDMLPAPGGGFYLALGGQIGSTVGKYNGVVVQVAADGDSFQVIASGFRQPYLGYDPETGTLTASDQQGNWKPATPIYRVENGRYFGFQPEKFKDKVVHPAPIHPAEVWIPHFINQSGASQVWVKGGPGGTPQMGPLNGSLVHIGYNRPEIFKIYLDPASQQGAVLPLLSGFPSGLLNGRIHPKDGLLYVTGFQVFGSSGSRTSGLFRVRQGNVPAALPQSVHAEKRGILLKFDSPLSADLAADLGRYSADRWNYRQTYQYGSGNYRPDNGQPGQEAIAISSAKLSADGKALFIGIRDMKPCHTLRLTYRVPAAGVERVENIYFTLHSLPSMNLAQQGFQNDEVDLSPRKNVAASSLATPPSAALGKEVSMRYGCIACHATGETSAAMPAIANGAAKTSVGPSWVGLWNSKRLFSDGSELLKADAAYIRESILDPARRVQTGFEMDRTGVGMPSYLGVLQDHEIDSLVLYISSLKK